MEAWQREYIVERKSDLLELTSCNSLLLSYLGGALSQAELDSLAKRSHNDGNAEASSSLYEILPKRIRGYEIMTKALFNCNQSGALAVFLEGFEKQSITNPFDICDIELEPSRFMDRVVTWQGAEEKLRNILKSVDEITMRAIFKKTLSGAEYLQLNDLKLPFCLFKDTVPAPLPHYVERYLIQRKYLDESLFKFDCSDIFVIKGLSRFQLSQLSSLKSSSSSSFNESDGVRFVHLESDQHFKKICDLTNVPTHLIHFWEGKYELKNTKGSLENIHRFFRQDTDRISEETFFEEHILDTEQNVCIADSPGMGKSVFLVKMANKCAVVGKSFSIFVKLEEFCQSLKTTCESFDEIPFHKLWDFIISYTAKTEFSAALLQELIVTNDIRLYLFLDGFDEIISSQREFAQNILKCLAAHCKPQSRINWRRMQFLVSTRLHLQSNLEVLIGSPAYGIAPFDRQNKIACVLNYWKNQGYEKTEAIVELAIAFLDSIDKATCDFEENVTDMPLICTLLAELYQYEAEQAYEKYPSNTNAKYCIKKKKLPRLYDFHCWPKQYIGSSITELYNRILYMRFCKGCNSDNSEKTKNGNIKILAENRSIYNTHVAAAIELLFPDWTEKLQMYFCNDSEPSSDEIYSVGIIEPKGFGKKPGFTHRSFAEYLVADFLFSKSEKNSESEDMAYFLFTRLLSTYEYSEQILKYPFVDPEAATFQSYRFIYPTIVDFINGLIKSKFQGGKFIKLPTCNSVPEAIKNSHLLYEMINACILPRHDMLISSVATTFLAGDTALFKLQLEECDVPWENLIYVAARHSNKTTLIKCYDLYHDCSRDNSDEIFKVANGAASLKKIVPLHVAAERGNYDIFEFLLKKQLKCEQRIGKLECMLHVCVNDTSNSPYETIRDKIEIIRCLINHSVDFRTEQEPLSSRSPLLMNNVHFDILTCLIRNGATLKTLDIHDNIIFRACKYLSPRQYYDLLLQVHEFKNAIGLFETETEPVFLKGTYDILTLNVMALLGKSNFLILAEAALSEVCLDQVQKQDECHNTRIMYEHAIKKQISNLGQRISFLKVKTSHFDVFRRPYEKDMRRAFLVDIVDTQDILCDNAIMKPVSNMTNLKLQSILRQLSGKESEVDLGEIFALWDEEFAYVSSQGLFLRRKETNEEDFEQLDFYGSEFKKSLKTLEVKNHHQSSGMKPKTPSTVGTPMHSSRETTGGEALDSDEESSSGVLESRLTFQEASQKPILSALPKDDPSRKTDIDVIYRGPYFTVTSPYWSRLRLWIKKKFTLESILFILEAVLIGRVYWAIFK